MSKLDSMNYKGSPNSCKSTVVGASPAKGVKLSRRFVINLTDEPIPKPNTNEQIHELEKKLLRYKKRYMEKKRKTYRSVEKNNEVQKELEETDLSILKLHHIAKENNTNFCNLKKENNKLISDIADLKISGNLNTLETLQESLFSKNEKARDLERLISKEKKKNEGLQKQARDLKIEFGSKNT